MRKYLNFCVIKSIYAIRTKFCTVINTTKFSLWVVPKFAPQIQNGRDCHLEKKINCYISATVPPIFMSYQKFTNEHCQLCSYWTKVHEICTRYRAIIYIEVEISHSISECQNDEWGEFVIFPQNWLPYQCPFIYKKRLSLIHI